MLAESKVNSLARIMTQKLIRAVKKSMDKLNKQNRVQLQYTQSWPPYLLVVLDRREVLYFDRRILNDDRITITVRYLPPKNAQVKGVSYARDFSFEKTFGV